MRGMKRNQSNMSIIFHLFIPKYKLNISGVTHFIQTEHL